MNILSCNKPSEFEYKITEKPQPKSGFAILKIQRIGICGTDLHAFEGTQPFFSYPRILGHELAATIEQIEDDTDFDVGESVTFIPYNHCGTCVACKVGKTNCCTHMQVCGVHVDGGMTEYLSVPVSSLLHGQGLSFNELALVEPLAIGAHGVRRSGVTVGENVLVIGAGPIGLGTMELTRIAGAKVIAMDINSQRLAFCIEKLKVNHTINALDTNVMEQLQDITNGEMPTVVIDATGSLKAINNAFQYIAHGGRYVLIGLQKDDISFSHPEFHKREATLISSRNATREDFDHVISCMKNGQIEPTNYITHEVNFNEVKTEFPNWLKPETGVIKAMVSMN
jgi:2-desacetyl-2-hydroxyethyl bacteriochlorophyllide A dehydrogenase